MPSTLRAKRSNLVRAALVVGLALLAVVSIPALASGLATMPSGASITPGTQTAGEAELLSPRAALRDALERAQQANSYRYTSDIDQTLIPRPVPGMIGQQDQHMTLAIEGEIQGAERSRTTLQFDPGGVSGVPNLKPVTIVRDGADVYAETDGKRKRFQNESLLAAPTDNVLDYLAAAENPRWLEPQTVNGTTYSRIGFDLRGEALLQRQQNRIKAAQPDAVVTMPETYQESTGSGELWLDPDGLPARQVINLELPRVSDQYHARLTMRLTYADFSGVPMANHPAGTTAAPPNTSAQPDSSGTAPRALDTSAASPSLSAPLGLILVFLLATLLFVALYRRNRRLAQAWLTWLLIASMVGAPPLQAAAAELNRNYNRSLPTLSELLGLPQAGTAPTTGQASSALSALQIATSSQASATNALIAKCGDGQAGVDTDGDTLSDLDEGCLGTNPYSADTDSDGLPDAYEVTQFTLGGKPWSLNPTKPDSNEDRLNDFLELPFTPVSMTVNNVLTTVVVGAAPVNPSSPSRLDWDNDGIPNTWDTDNDGDGIHDALDLSAYAVGSYKKEFRVSSRGQGYTGTQYLEFQIQPQNPAHLRYGMTVFDWPLDDKGAMQDYQGEFKALVRLLPFLEVVVNESATPRTYAAEYGVDIRDERPAPGYRSLYVPLQPVGSGGGVNAFYAKVAFASSELQTIDWRARLVWMVQGDSQTQISGAITTAPQLLHVYRDESTRVAGFKVTKSDRAENFILGEPSSPTEDAHLMGAAVGLNMFFLGAGIVPTPTAGLSTLQEAANRFNSTTVAKELRFNLPNTLTLPAYYKALPHVDAAIKDLGVAVNQYLKNNNFAAYFNNPAAVRCNDGTSSNIRCASLLVAMDERFGELSQEDVAVTSGAVAAGDDYLRGTGSYERFEVNLNTITTARRKMLKLQVYENIGSDWRSIDIPRAMAIIFNRYESQRSVLEPLLKARYPNQTWQDTQQVIFGFYLGALVGSSTLQFDNETLTPQANDVVAALEATNVFGGATASIGRLAGDINETLVANGSPFLKQLPNLSKAIKSATPGNAAVLRQPAVRKLVAQKRFNLLLDRFDLAFNASQVAVGLVGIAVAIANAACGEEEGNTGQTTRGCNAAAMQGMVYVSASLNTAVAAIDMAYKVYKIYTAIKSGTTLTQTFTAVKFVSTAGKVAGALAIVGFAIGLGVNIAELVVTINTINSAGLSHLFIRQAVAVFIGQLIWAAIALVLTFIPGVGQIIAAILALIDAIVALVTGGQSSAAREIVKFFYDVKVVSFLHSTNFRSGSSAFANPDQGMTEGNTYLLKSFFTGVITTTQPPGSPGQRRYEQRLEFLNLSSAEGYYKLPITDTLNSTSQLPKYCDPASLRYVGVPQAKVARQCTNELVAKFKLQRGINRVFRIRSQIDFAYVVVECSTFLSFFTIVFGGGGEACFDTDVTHTQIGDKETDPTTGAERDAAFSPIYLDVLPATLDYFVNNWDIYGETFGPGQGGLQKWNLDLDGDGLGNRLETGGLNPNNWDTDGDGLSDRFERDNGLIPTQADTDGDGLNDGDELRVDTRPLTADSDGDGLKDGEEVSHGPSNNFALVGWDITLPSGKIARVFPDAVNPDQDLDQLTDSTEHAEGYSPWATNTEPTLALAVLPYTFSPNHDKEGVYVAPGQAVTITLGLSNFASYSISNALTLCVPNEIVNVQGAVLTGNNHAPATGTGTCAGGTQYAWSFARPNNLLFAEVVSATLSGRADPALTASREVTVTARISLRNGPAEVSHVVRIDGDLPEVSVTSLQSGDIIQRPPGGGTLIVGGVSSDLTSWVTQVEINTGSGFISTTDVSPWAYAWTLPPDGVYSVQARATDFVGHVGVSAPVTNVIVDGSNPTATLSWSGVLYARPDANNTLTLNGSAGDNLAGLQRVDVSIDGRAYQGTNFTAGSLSTAWNYVWQLPSDVEKAQGTHVISVLARDKAGNVSAVNTARLVVDALPPTSDLVTRLYLNPPAPVLKSGVPITLYGRANDAGNQPLPPSPVRLQGLLDAITHTTVFFGADAPNESGGVTLAWAGDIDGDRRADFVTGLPNANGGTGRVNVLYGRSGDFRTPPNVERLGASRASFVGVANAGIGQYVSPVGDVNGDAFNDLLIGDAANQRAFLVFGVNGAFGSDIVLSDGVSGQRSVMSLQLSGGQTQLLAPAGDVNGDGFADLLAGVSGGGVTLLMGRSGAWETSLDIYTEAALTFTLPLNGSASGVGDVTGDGRADFVIASGNSVKLYAGSATFVKNGRLPLPSPIATFSSADANPRVAPLGDIDGDGLADFAFSNGSAPQFVRGRSSGAWGVSFSLSAAPGFMASVGDVNADGKADFVLNAGGGDANLYHGASGTPSVAATIARVANVAAMPLGAGADLNCDASADLLLLPNAAPPHPAPNVATGDVDTTRPLPPLYLRNLNQTSFGFAGNVALFDAPIGAANVVVDDDYCVACANDGYVFGSTAFNTIQAAVDAVPAGGRVNVMPGVYAAFTVSGKNDVTVIGAGRRAGGESVFVDGAGGAFAARVSNATGVRISNMLVRNAQVGIDLVDAGINGSVAVSTNITLRTKLDRLIIHGFSVAGVQMTRNSTADLTRATLVGQDGGGPHFNIVGAADATPPNKLAVSALLIVAPPASTAFTWFTPSAPMPDFNTPACCVDVTFVDGATGTTWTPAVGSSFPRASLSFKDEARHVYYPRRNIQWGFHSDRPYYATAYVAPDYYFDGSTIKDVNTFRSIQAALNSGIKRIVLLPGVYREAFYLTDGVDLVGSGADQTIVELPAGVSRPAVQADGARSASLFGVSIVAPGGTAFSAKGGAIMKLTRSIIRDSAVAVALDGAATDVEIVNNNVVRNGEGIQATNNALIRVRNTIFANNSGTALSFQSGAATKVHEYNDYFGNGAELRIDGVATPATGPGEIVQDPLFNNPEGNDFRLRYGSALINAGSPSDPTPPGTGGRVDIGYRENGLGAFYVSPSYCETCANDGLQWYVNAFDSIGAAVYAAGEFRKATCVGVNACDAQVDVNVAPGSYLVLSSVYVPGGIRLLGSGAEQTTISGLGGGTTLVDLSNASNVEVSGFTLTGGYIGVVASGGDNILIQRNILRGNTIGVHFSFDASGQVNFNTIVNNTTGLSAFGVNTQLLANSNIVANNTSYGVQATNGAGVSVRFSLLNANGQNLAGVSDDASNLLNVDPLFVDAGSNNYALQSASPAVDAADPALGAVAGGGNVADMGYRELLAAPVALLMGAVGTSCGVGASGVASLDFGNVTVANPDAALTATLPLTWQAAAVASPGAVASNWNTTIVPAGDGLRRLYSRATDVLGSQEAPRVDVTDRFGERLPSPVLNLYDGAYYADDSAPVVTMAYPSADVSVFVTSLGVSAVVTDTDPAGRFTASKPYFVTNGDYVPGIFDQRQSVTNTKVFYAYLNIARAQTYTVTAYAQDEVGHLSNSASVRITSTLNPDPETKPVVEITLPASGTIFGVPPTITVRGTVSWTHPVSRGLDLFYCDPGCVIYQPYTPTLADPYADVTAWSIDIPLLAPTQWVVAQAEDANSIAIGGCCPYGQSATVDFFLDDLPPLFAMMSAVGVITRAIVLNGSVTDQDAIAALDTIFIDRVEMSTDNGGNWLPIDKQDATPPGNVTTTFTSVFTPPVGADYLPMPVLFRAWDKFGNSNTYHYEDPQIPPLIVDNVPPQLAQPTFNIPPGSYLDSIQTLVMSWITPTDGSGVFTITASIDQISQTVPSAVQALTSTSQSLNSDGQWYAHLSGVDPIGNRTTYDVGPWYVNILQLCNSPALNILLDGAIDTATNEWKANTFLDDDERPAIASATSGTLRAQKLYSTWDANAFYIGWQGAQWGFDGALFAYLSTGAGSNSTALISPTTASNVLPFAADMAVVVDGPTAGRLYRVVGGVWQLQGALQFNLGGSSDTELRAPVASPLVAGTNVRMMAFGRKDDGDVFSAFPTTNPLSGTWISSYNWSPICSVTDPNAGQPSAANIAATMSVSESVSVPYPPNGALHYAITLRNYEQRPVANTSVTLTGTSGLGFTAIASDVTVNCSACAPGSSVWSFSLPSVLSDSTSLITVTGQLAANLSGVEVVTGTLAATNDGNLVGADAIARRADSTGPNVSIDTKALQPGPQTPAGEADDNDGIGVALVEVNVNGGGWQPAIGTNNWTLPINVPNVTSLPVQVRATDAYGQVGPVQAVTFVVDNQPPQVTVDPPAVFTSLSPSFPGTAFDPPVGGPIANIEVKLNDTRSVWQPVVRTATTSTGITETWSFAPNSQSADGVTYTAQARAQDEAGNTGYSVTKTFILDNIPPAITPTFALTTAIVPTTGVMLLQGAVTDGSGVQQVQVRIHDPNGDVYTETATLIGSTWSFTPTRPFSARQYSLRVFATDIYGNESNVGPFDFGQAPGRIFLPSVMQAYPSHRLFLPLAMRMEPAYQIVLRRRVR